MQSVSSRIWTRVAVSISNGDSHYTTDTSITSIWEVIMGNILPLVRKIPNSEKRKIILFTLFAPISWLVVEVLLK